MTIALCPAVRAVPLATIYHRAQHLVLGTQDGFGWAISQSFI